MIKFKTLLNEISLARFYTYINDDHFSFGLISANRNECTPEENKKRHYSLIHDIKGNYPYTIMGGGFREIFGKDENDKDITVDVEEDSILVYNIPRMELVDLGKKYDQEAVIYKNREIFVSIHCLGDLYNTVGLEFQIRTGKKGFNVGGLDDDEMNNKDKFVYFSKITNGTNNARRRFSFNTYD